MKKKQCSYNWLWVLVALIIFVYFWYSYLVVDINIEPVQGSITQDWNVYKTELYTDNITFGAMPQGVVLHRESKVHNNYSFPVKTYFFSTGDISDRLYIQPHSIYLEANETKQMDMFFLATSQAGEYKGKLIILTRRTILGR